MSTVLVAGVNDTMRMQRNSAGWFPWNELSYKSDSGQSRSKSGIISSPDHTATEKFKIELEKMQ